MRPCDPVGGGHRVAGAPPFTFSDRALQQLVALAGLAVVGAAERRPWR